MSITQGGYSRQSPMVDASHFAMVPRSDVPRSVFKVEHGHKTTFNSQYLVPIYCQEILPGDAFHVKATMFTRLSTLIFPLMDSLELCTFFFFVPNRLVWANWQKFMGEQNNPGDSISYTVPVFNFNPATDIAVCGIFDYFGLPVPRTSGVNPGTYSANCLPLRAYNLIYNQWFRDENVVNSTSVATNDGPDIPANYALRKRAKRHDYFTSCLPFAQKGTAASIPLAGTAPIKGLGLTVGAVGTTGATFVETQGSRVYANAAFYGRNGAAVTGAPDPGGIGVEQNASGVPQVFADLSAATAVTINALRQSFQVQKLLERDARGGTRYTEILRSHFGVVSPDARLQRPEYLGGGCSPLVVNPVAQTAITGTTPQGNLSGVGHGVASHGFSKSFVEHGYVIGLVNVRANISYQQGLHKMWSRSTRYDFYWPAFAHLGEQAVLNQEIVLTGGGSATDTTVFGYQERWAEYRYAQSQITGKFRSAISGTLDSWHLSESFATVPSLNQTFIEAAPPMSRVYAAGGASANQEFLLDALFETRMTRAMPVYSVPGFVDRF